MTRAISFSPTAVPTTHSPRNRNSVIAIVDTLHRGLLWSWGDAFARKNSVKFVSDSMWNSRTLGTHCVCGDPVLVGKVAVFFSSSMVLVLRLLWKISIDLVGD